MVTPVIFDGSRVSRGDCGGNFNLYVAFIFMLCCLLDLFRIQITNAPSLHEFNTLGLRLD
jgi:hypothetical protein